MAVAVAASMRYAFEDLSAAFTKEHPGLRIEASYGASGVFFAQLTHRAPFDLFLSADCEYPGKLRKEGLGEETFPYASGNLVLWAQKSAALDVSSRGLAALNDPKIAKISIANPDTAPYGRAAMEAIRSVPGLENAVKAKLVFAENVGQAAQYVQSGAAQIGLFAESLTKVGDMEEAGDWMRIDPTVHVPIVQCGIILSWARDKATAEAFRDFLRSEEAAALFQRHGFSLPEN